MPNTLPARVLTLAQPPRRRDAPPIVSANLEIRPAELQVFVDGSRAALTVREFQILHALASHPERVLPRQEIYDIVWGGQMAYRDRSVDVFVRKVRLKLAALAPEWTYIHTHFGIGYRFDPEQALADPDRELERLIEGELG